MNANTYEKDGKTYKVWTEGRRDGNESKVFVRIFEHTFQIGAVVVNSTRSGKRIVRSAEKFYKLCTCNTRAEAMAALADYRSRISEKHGINNWGDGTFASFTVDPELRVWTGYTDKIHVRLYGTVVAGGTVSENLYTRDEWEEVRKTLGPDIL